MGFACKDVSLEFHQRWRSFSYQETLLLHQHAEIPCAVAVGLALIDDDGVEQALTTNQRNHRILGLNVTETLSEHLTKDLSLLNHVLLLNNLKRSNSNGGTKRVTAVSATVSARLDGEHDFLLAENSRDRVHATTDSLAEKDKVGLDTTPFVAQHLASASNSSLNLVTDHQDVVLVAQLTHFSEVVLIRHDDTCFTLNGLDQESGSVLAVLLKHLLEICNVVVADWLVVGRVAGANVGQVGTVVVSGLGVSGHGDGCELHCVLASAQKQHAVLWCAYCSTVEVLLRGEDPGLILRNALDLVSPFACNLDGSLHSLSTSVHGQDHLETQHRGDLLGEAREDIVVECARAQRES